MRLMHSAEEQKVDFLFFLNVTSLELITELRCRTLTSKSFVSIRVHQL